MAVPDTKELLWLSLLLNDRLGESLELSELGQP